MTGGGTRRLWDGLLAGAYLLLACGMYYFHTEYIDLGVHFMYKFVLAAVLVAGSAVYQAADIPGRIRELRG